MSLFADLVTWCKPFLRRYLLNEASASLNRLFMAEHAWRAMIWDMTRSQLLVHMPVFYIGLRMMAMSYQEI